MHVHPRLGAEGDRGRDVRQAIDQPLLAEVVVDDEQAVGSEAVADGAERLLGEHVALEAHAREARLQRQRINQRKDDEVVFLVRGAEEVPGVVVDDRYARIVERMVGMQALAEPEDRRVDLHGIDVLGAVHQRGRDVGAGAGAENQHVLEAVAKDRVRPLIEVFLLRDRGHRLVKDVVHLDDRVGCRSGRR